MRRWYLFPTIALLAIAIGLVWNFATLNSAQSPTAQSSIVEQHDRISSPSPQDKTSNPFQSPEVVPTALQPEETPEMDRLLEESLEESGLSLIESLTKDDLQSLIAAAGANATKSAIQSVAPSVVQISVLSVGGGSDPLAPFRDNPFFEDFFDFDQQAPQGNQPQAGMGSGFFIEYDGEQYVMTNNHVVQGATQITLSPPSGETFEAEIVGRDEVLDIAVLRVLNDAASHVEAVQLGDSDALEVGDWVTAIGNPFGLEHTVTSGIVSAVERDIVRPDRTGWFRDMIQTDAAINPGNSGGPLVNAKGEVIGINTAIIANAPGLGFTIPINTATRVLQSLVNIGHIERAWLGIAIDNITEERAAQFGIEPFMGVLITQVGRGAPAEGSLRAGDIVYFVEGEAVNSISELQDSVQYRSPGDTIELELLRGGTMMNVYATLGSRPNEQQAQQQFGNDEPAETPDSPSDENASPDTEGNYHTAFGITVAANNEEFAEDHNLPTDQGVVITHVNESSPANSLSVGQVIIKVNDYTIESFADWIDAIEAVEDASMISIQAIGPNSVNTAIFPNQE